MPKLGIAVTFVDWDDMHKWSLINRALDMGQPEPVETYSSSPHLYTDLDIPEGSKGRLKTAGPPRVHETKAPERGGRATTGNRSAGTSRDSGRSSGAQRSSAPSSTADSQSTEPRAARSRQRSRTRRPSTPPAA